MRSLFGFIVFISVLIALIGAFLVPSFVKPMVASAVRSASPFGEQPLEVDVEVDALGLIRGFVGGLHISGTDLERESVTIGSLDIGIDGVGIGDHRFASIAGGLDDVAIPLGGSGDAPVIIDRIELSGSSDALTATARLDRFGAIAFIERAFLDQGAAVAGLELIDGGVSLVIFETRVQLVVDVGEGSLVVPDMLGAGQLDLLVARPDDPWRLTDVTITPDGMEVVALVDAEALLATEE